MVKLSKTSKLIGFVKAFFPFQLITYQLKYNLFSVFLWTLLFLIISDSIGYSFGIPLLFLSPEYLGEVGPMSFLYLGLALGGFTMGFNTFSYIKLGPHFPFLTTLAKPFFKFCINNSTIPLLFLAYFSYQTLQFQTIEELHSLSISFYYLFIFFIGFFFFISISFAFFFRVGRKRNEKRKNEQSAKPISSFFHKKERWFDYFKKDSDRYSIYIGSKLKLKPSRSLKHFDQKLVQEVFSKNRISSSVFEVATITVFIIIGAFNSYDAFNVPASVSIVLLLTIFQMIFSALHSWFKAWSYPLIILILFSMNFISTRSDYFKYSNYAYGLDYKKTDEYSIERIKSFPKNTLVNKESFESYIATLNNWKKKTGKEKPVLIIVNSSGGGSRSALWNMAVLQGCDTALNENFTNSIQLITGASGGMIGSSYFRELLLRHHLGDINSIHSDLFSKNISKDMLNSLAFMGSTHDLFIRYQKFNYYNKQYTKDRGFAFEEQLHRNTNDYLKHNLAYYSTYERTGEIPTMIFAPTIINDGRRLLISSQNLNFLTSPYHNNKNLPSAIENLDINSLLSNQNISELRFSSVLRMNATFPFVMPMVTLPTEPQVQIMDAGIRDNYGGKITSEFIFVLREWIEENTSGVVILQIRDTKNILEGQKYASISMLDKLSLPFGNMYKNFPKVQDFNQEELFKISLQSYKFPVDIVSFNLREKNSDRISLSWHLTKQEKNKIKEAFNSNLNKSALEKLREILE